MASSRNRNSRDNGNSGRSGGGKIVVALVLVTAVAAGVGVYLYRRFKATSSNTSNINTGNVKEKVGSAFFPTTGVYTINSLNYGYLNTAIHCNQENTTMCSYKIPVFSDTSAEWVLRPTTATGGTINHRGENDNSGDGIIAACTQCGSSASSTLCIINSSLPANWSFYTKASAPKIYYMRNTTGQWIIGNSADSCSSILPGLSEPSLGDAPSNALGFEVKFIRTPYSSE